MPTEFIQTKAEQIFYTWDFTDIINGNHIDSFQIDSDGLTIASSSKANKSVSAKVITSNAEVSKIYRLVCTANISSLEVLQIIISILIVEA